MEEPAARAIVGKCGKLRARLSASLTSIVAFGPPISAYPAGMRGVRFDFAVAQFYARCTVKEFSAALDAS